MICYRDMTFCTAECKTLSCHRNQKNIDQYDLKRVDLPLSLADYSSDCPKYEPDEKET